MTYTEIKERKGKKYYYRVRSIRNGKKFRKERIYLGKNLTEKELNKRVERADTEFIKNVLNKNVEKIKSKIVKILRKSHIKKAGIFGSYVSGKQKKQSDIDILIMPSKKMSLLDLSGLKIELEETLGKKVDLVSYNYIHPYLKDKILESEVKII